MPRPRLADGSRRSSRRDLPFGLQRRVGVGIASVGTLAATMIWSGAALANHDPSVTPVSELPPGAVFPPFPPSSQLYRFEGRTAAGYKIRLQVSKSVKTLFEFQAHSVESCQSPPKQFRRRHIEDRGYPIKGGSFKTTEGWQPVSSYNPGTTQNHWLQLFEHTTGVVSSNLRQITGALTWEGQPDPYPGSPYASWRCSGSVPYTADRVFPKLSLLGKRRLRLRRKESIQVRADQVGAIVKVKARVSRVPIVKTARKKKAIRLKGAKLALEPGTPGVARVTFSRSGYRTVKRALKARRRVKLKVVATTSDAGGNRVTVKRSFRLKR